MSKPDHAGPMGEDFVEELCSMPFGKDFLFRNPKYDSGRHELCDLLLYLGDSAVLMEVKTADRRKRPGRSEPEWVEWANKRLAKSIAQLQRAVDALLAGKVRHISNERQGVVELTSPPKHIYAIAVIDHPPLAIVGRPRSLKGGAPIPVLTTTHSNLIDVLQELSTPGDLIDYFHAREAFFAKNILAGATELDLLAAYKMDPDEFIENVHKLEVYIVMPNTWQGFVETRAREKRRRLDVNSRLVDIIIDTLHESRHADLPHINRRLQLVGIPTTPNERPSYTAIAHTLALIRRVDRRNIGNALVEKSGLCLSQQRNRWFASIPFQDSDKALVWLLSTQDRESRLSFLEWLVLGCLVNQNIKCVIGIATEPVNGNLGFSVDAFMLSHDPAALRSSLTSQQISELEGLFVPRRPVGLTEFGEPDERSP